MACLPPHACQRVYRGQSRSNEHTEAIFGQRAAQSTQTSLEDASCRPSAGGQGDGGASDVDASRRGGSACMRGVSDGGKLCLLQACVHVRNFEWCSSASRRRSSGRQSLPLAAETGGHDGRAVRTRSAHFRGCAEETRQSSARRLDTAGAYFYSLALAGRSDSITRVGRPSPRRRRWRMRLTN